MEFIFKRFFVLLVLLAVSGALCPGQSEMDWPGWRGLSKQGQSTPSGPTTWSSESNVAWKTDIPGQGHSSPVIVGDNIIVTTAYSAKDGRKTRQMGMYIILALALLLIFSSIPYFFRYYLGKFSCKAGQFRSMLMFCLLMGLLLHIILLLCQRISEADHVSRHMVWLQSFMLAGTGFAILATTLPNRLIYRIVLGIIVIAFIGPLILLRPNPEYYVLFNRIPGTNADYLPPAYVTITLLICVGFASLAGAFLRFRKQDDDPNQVPETKNRRMFLFSLAAFTTAFFCGLVGFGLIYWVPIIIRQGWFSIPRNLAFWFNWESLMAMGCFICLALWGLIQVFSNRIPSIQPHRFFSTGVLILVVLCLIVANYIGRQNSYARSVICIDRNTGAVKWQCDGLSGPKVSIHKDNSLATPTPVIHRGKVYAYFGTVGLMCTDLQGNLLWTDTNLPFEGVHGVGASLMAEDDYIIVTSMNSKTPYITAFHSETDDRLWTAEFTGWPGMHGQHRTPVIAELHNTKVVLNWCKMQKKLSALELSSGKELWSFHPEDRFSGEAVASILHYKDTLYLPSRTNFVAIDVSSLATGGSARKLWGINLRNKGPVTPSPVMHNGLIFTVSDWGHASCLNADNGELLWQENLPRGNYLASPIIMGQNIYFCSTSGTTTVVACDSTFKQVAQNVLPNGIYSTPAPVGKNLYIRTTSRLWCIE